MKICVFGGSGYVGASVYNKLHMDWDVDVVGTYLNEPAFPNMVQLDINEPETFSQFYKKEKPDVVVWSVMAGPDEVTLSARGLIHLITHLTPNTKLIYLSSDFVFAEGKGPYLEDDVLKFMPEERQFSNYANAKIKAEKLIQQELTNYLILRAGPVFGTNAVGRCDKYTEVIQTKLAKGETAPFRDDLIRTFIHIDDLASIVCELAQTTITGILHVGRENDQSFYEFMREQAKYHGMNEDLIIKDVEGISMTDTPKNLSLITNKVQIVTQQTIR